LCGGSDQSRLPVTSCGYFCVQIKCLFIVSYYSIRFPAKNQGANGLARPLHGRAVTDKRLFVVKSKAVNGKLDAFDCFGPLNGKNSRSL
jgi:hypothetical protein